MPLDGAVNKLHGQINSNLKGKLEYIGNYNRTTTSILLDSGEYLIIISSSSINTAGYPSSIAGASDIKTIIQNNNTVNVAEGTAGNYINIFTARVTDTPLTINFGASNARQTTIFKIQ